MTLGHEVAWALPELQREAESRMTDAGTMYRFTGRTVQDEDTGKKVRQFDTVFTSKCRIQARNVQALVEQVGGRSAVTVRLELHLPVSAAVVQVGDEWLMTAAVHDSQLVGRRFRVTAPVAKSQATARRFEVEEVVS